MPMPKSVVKFDKKGIKFTSEVDRVNYTINELTRAALKDVAKVLRKLLIEKLKKLPGMKRNRRIYNSTQYWVRKIDKDLQIGFKHNTWYGPLQELGSKNQPKKGILRETVYENIPLIVEIESKYLSAIESEAKALALIDEQEGVSDNE